MSKKKTANTICTEEEKRELYKLVSLRSVTIKKFYSELQDSPCNSEYMSEADKLLKEFEVLEKRTKMITSTRFSTLNWWNYRTISKTADDLLEKMTRLLTFAKADEETVRASEE